MTDRLRSMVAGVVQQMRAQPAAASSDVVRAWILELEAALRSGPPAPLGRSLSLSIDTPPSLKNQRSPSRVAMNQRGDLYAQRFTTGEVKRAMRAIQGAANEALYRQARASYMKRQPLFADGEDVSVDLVYDWGNERVSIVVQEIGPKPPPRATKRDVVNIPDLVCDALQGFAYRNDKQVAALRVWRMCGPSQQP